MTDIEFAKAIDICEKLDFFGGCREGRELWFGKPADVQDIDIQNFAEDVAFLKDFINRQKAETEELQGTLKFVRGTVARLLETSDKQQAKIEKLKEAYAVYEETTGLKQAREDAIRKFADWLKLYLFMECGGVATVSGKDIDHLVKEMTERQP